MNKYVRKVGDYAVLAAGLSGDYSDRAVGHLIAVDNEGRICFVSRAVTRAIVDKCEAQAITMAGNLSVEYQNNGTFDGWVFEFDFLMRLCRACGVNGTHSVTLTTDRQTSTTKTWQAHRRVPFKLAAGVENLSQAYFTTYTWYIPQKVNQGGFDVIMVTGPNSLRFVQLTVSPRYSLKLKYLREFGTVWQKKCERSSISVELVAVVPAGSQSNFQWDDAEGSVPATWNLQVRTVFLQRTGVAPSI